MSDAAARVAEHTARASYGRLLALLATRSDDLVGAEDALAEAFRAALETWPQRGVPDNPQAWLLTVARNHRLDGVRSAATRTSVELDDDLIDTMRAPNTDPDAIPDERLKLLFVCAHPAIDAALRTPLMLQTVLGLEAEQIGRAFPVPGPTMAQRLVRVKRKIKEAAIPFTLPSRSDMPERLEAVLEAIYGAHAIGWAQLDVAGCFVPLDQQDTALWDGRLIAWGERLLRRASQAGAIGRFQLEAAIQSAHNERLHTGHTDWAARWSSAAHTALPLGRLRWTRSTPRHKRPSSRPGSRGRSWRPRPANGTTRSPRSDGLWT